MSEAEIDDIESALAEPVATDIYGSLNLSPSQMVPTGSTLLDLGLSGTVHGGWVLGGYYSLAGESGAGKTFLVWSTFAAAAAKFPQHRLILDDPERGSLMDKSLFGQAAARVSPPCYVSGEPCHSDTVEDFYANIQRNIDSVPTNGPFIYVLDSMDSLSSEMERRQLAGALRANEVGDEAAGDYGDGKARINSRRLRGVVSQLAGCNSMLIVISQVREDLKARYKRDSISGGRAIKFYAACQVTIRRKSPITKEVTVQGQKVAREIGMVATAAAIKNRITGQNNWASDITIDISYGIDDVTDCLTWLNAHNFLERPTAQRLDISPIDPGGFVGILPRCAERIEQQRLEPALKEYMAKCWAAVNAKFRSARRRNW